MNKNKIINNDEGSVVPHLLDNTSDYNNFSNLSYFISEYKKAVQIIKQCKNFYKQFIRTKLYNYDQLKDININPYKIDVFTESYHQHCRKLENYIINRWLEKEINSSLKTYKLVFNKDCYINKVKESYWDPQYNEWELMPSKNAYIQNFKYLQDFKRHFSIGVKLKNDPQYTRDERDVFNEKILVEYVNKQLIDDNEVFDLTLYKWDFKENRKTKKYEDVYTPIKRKVKCTLLHSEENKLISILHEAAVRFDKLYDDIYCNPKNYLNEWEEYKEFVKNNYKYIHIYTHDGYYTSENYEGAKIDKEKEQRRDSIDELFLPIELTIDKKTYLFEGYEFKNKNKESYRSNDYEHFISYTKLLNDYLIPYYGEYYENEKNNWLSKNDEHWYYIVIDSIAYKFAHYIDDVKITLEEENNLLTCEYKTTERHQKWRWPSDSPYVVTNEYFEIHFSTLTNEPIYYNTHKDTYEENNTRY